MRCGRGGKTSRKVKGSRTRNESMEVRNEASRELDAEINRDGATALSQDRASPWVWYIKRGRWDWRMEFGAADLAGSALLGGDCFFFVMI